MKKTICWLFAAALGCGCATFPKPEPLGREQRDALSELRRELSNGKILALDDFLMRIGNPPLYAARQSEQEQIRDGLRRPHYLMTPVFASGYGREDLKNEETEFFAIATNVVQAGLTKTYTVQFNYIFLYDEKVIAASFGGQKLSDFRKNWELIE